MKTKKQKFTTTHNLQYFQAVSNYAGELEFKVGTVHGIFHFTRIAIEITAIINDSPGNGHFEDVLQWFEHAAKEQRRNLCFLHVNNLAFRKHLIEKRGFVLSSYRRECCMKIIN